MFLKREVFIIGEGKIVTSSDVGLEYSQWEQEYFLYSYIRIFKYILNI